MSFLTHAPSKSLLRCMKQWFSAAPMQGLKVRCASTSRGGYMSHAERDKRRRESSFPEESKAMERNFTREWKVGDVYAPHDLSAAEARKWRRRYSPTTDAFDALNLNPLDLYKNFSVMSEYMTEMGRIRPRTSTGLRRVNQRKIAKSIRRAIALGLMPSVHRHPEILKHQLEQRKQNTGGRF